MQQTDGVTNLFVHRSAAQRYAASRPYFHPQVVARIRTTTGTARFGRALDVACGTGQSARALAAIADVVDAVDISPDMIAEAEPHARLRFQVAPAERLPFADGSFDLVTVGLAFHWFDQPAFLAEARRVLRPLAWLVVYTSGFAGEMVDNPRFRQWAWTDYPGRFPTPPRRATGVDLTAVAPFEFLLVGTDDFAHTEVMSAERLTGYLLTQTNVIAAVENGSTPLDDAAAWIAAGVSPYFDDKTAAMHFGGSISYLRRTGAE